MDEMTVAEAATTLGKSARQVQHLVLTGKLQARRVGARLYLIDRTSVERHAREGRTVGRPRIERSTA